MPAALDPAKRAAILDDIRAGQESCRGIAREHGVSRTTVSKLAQDAGLADAFGRQKTQKATAARVVDSKAARSIEAIESISVAAVLREKVRNAEAAKDAQSWAIAYGIMSDKHLTFERFDTDNGAAEARSMLSALAAGLQAAHDQLAADES